MASLCSCASGPLKAVEILKTENKKTGFADMAARKCPYHNKWCEDPAQQKAMLQALELKQAAALLKSKPRKPVKDYANEYK